MHLGNVFSVVLAWASARSHDAAFLLRMEDIDERSKPEFAELIRADLHWLGLDWDAEAPLQSTRTAAYAEALERIAEQARMYPCFCSRADLHAASAPHASDDTLLYAGPCKGLSAAHAEERSLVRSPAWRVEVPDVSVAFEDGCQGRYDQRLARECGDFVLRRSDGVYAYQLAVVVDDAAAGVTEVVRGADLISSTPRQIWLYGLLGEEPPAYYHHPVLLAADGRRLSKRDADAGMDALKERFERPEALLGHVAALAGVIEREEPLSAAELVAEFSWERVRREDITVA